VGLEDPDGLAGLDEHGLVAVQPLQGADDGVQGLDISRRFPTTAIDDQVLGILGDLRIEVVQQAAKSGLLEPSLGVEVGPAWSMKGEREIEHVGTSLDPADPGAGKLS
jgi:hypothetical protein